MLYCFLKLSSFALMLLAEVKKRLKNVLGKSVAVMPSEVQFSHLELDRCLVDLEPFTECDCLALQMNR
jgi:hypothetical protein